VPDKGEQAIDSDDPPTRQTRGTNNGPYSGSAHRFLRFGEKHLDEKRSGMEAARTFTSLKETLVKETKRHLAAYRA